MHYLLIFCLLVFTSVMVRISFIDSQELTISPRLSVEPLLRNFSFSCAQYKRPPLSAHLKRMSMVSSSRQKAMLTDEAMRQAVQLMDGTLGILASFY